MSIEEGYTEARRALTAARATVFSLDMTVADTHSVAYGLQRIAEETGGFYASSLDRGPHHLKTSRSFLSLAATPALRSATSLIEYSTELPSTIAISDGMRL